MASEGEVGCRNLDEDRLEPPLCSLADRIERPGRVLERQLVEEQGVEGAHADHVVVEGPACNRRPALAREDSAGRAMTAGDGL